MKNAPPEVLRLLKKVPVQHVYFSSALSLLEHGERDPIVGWNGQFQHPESILSKSAEFVLEEVRAQHNACSMSFKDSEGQSARAMTGSSPWFLEALAEKNIDHTQYRF